MRTLDEHKINPGNDTLTITVLDEPGHGGLVAGGSLSTDGLEGNGGNGNV